jgi:hypothetical protein
MCGTPKSSRMIVTESALVFRRSNSDADEEDENSSAICGLCEQALMRKRNIFLCKFKHHLASLSLS